MFDFAISGLTALFFAGFWSRLRWGFFDLFCYVAAVAGALAVPPLLHRYFPMLIELGGVEVDAAGALIGCLVYDMSNYGFR